MKIAFVPNERATTSKEAVYSIDRLNDKQKGALKLVRKEIEILAEGMDNHEQEIEILFSKYGKGTLWVKNWLASHPAFNYKNNPHSPFLSPDDDETLLAMKVLHDELRVLRGEGRWEMRENISEDLAAE